MESSRSGWSRRPNRFHKQVEWAKFIDLRRRAQPRLKAGDLRVRRCSRPLDETELPNLLRAHRSTQFRGTGFGASVVPSSVPNGSRSDEKGASRKTPNRGGLETPSGLGQGSVRFGGAELPFRMAIAVADSHLSWLGAAAAAPCQGVCLNGSVDGAHLSAITHARVYLSQPSRNLTSECRHPLLYITAHFGLFCVDVVDVTHTH